MQDGVSEAGCKELGKVVLPKDVQVTPEADKSLSEMLLNREIDALISARPSEAFLAGDGKMVRLIASSSEVERDFFRRTDVYQIMHMLAIKREVYERNPWIAMNLMTAFERAKVLMVGRISDIDVSQIPIP